MIYGARIKQARELRGWTQAQLAEKVSKDQSLIAYVESGFKEASDNLLTAISDQTNLPISFFSQPPQSILPGGSLLFRAHASLTKRESTEALRNAELVFDLGLHLLSHVDLKPANILSRSEEPEDAARRVRASLGILPHVPVTKLLRTLEKSGIWVLPIPRLEGREAFSVWATAFSREIPVMAVSTGRPGDRLRFSVAHELGHLVLHKQLPFKTVSQIEEDANKFAAEFLMPADVMRKELSTPISLTTVARLKPKWGVAMQALIYRAKQLHIISDRQYRYLFQQLSARGWRTAEPINLDVKIEKPRLIAKMAEVVYGTPIRYSKLSAAIHVTESEVRTILSNFAQKEEFNEDSAPVAGNVITFSRR